VRSTGKVGRGYLGHESMSLYTPSELVVSTLTYAAASYEDY